MNVDELFLQRYGTTPSDFSAENVTPATPLDPAASPWKPLDMRGLASAGKAVREKFEKPKPTDEEQMTPDEVLYGS